MGRKLCTGWSEMTVSCSRTFCMPRSDIPAGQGTGRHTYISNDEHLFESPDCTFSIGAPDVGVLNVVRGLCSGDSIVQVLAAKLRPATVVFLVRTPPWGCSSFTSESRKGTPAPEY